MILSKILLIAGIVLMLLALVLLFKPWIAAALPAYAGLWLMHLSTYTTFPQWIFIFYGVTTLMVMGIKYLQPKGEPGDKSTGNLYLALGAIMGQLAFSMTPHGKWLKFPKSNFIQYLCAKGLAVIVAVAMMGLAVEGFVFDIK